MDDHTDPKIVSEQTTPMKMVIAWAAGQPFTNVLLAVLLGMNGWIAWYGATVAIPEHLKMIQSGYKEIDLSDKEERQKDRDQYDKWIDLMINKTQPQTVSN